MGALSVEGNLLFGLLALQVGLIDQDALLGAFRVWTRDKKQDLVDLLTARGELDAADRAAVEAVVARHLGRHHGQLDRSLAALTTATKTWQKLAELGDPDLEAGLSRLLSGTTQPETDLTADRSASPAGSNTDRFQLLRPHAKGGLGAVFVAMDSELSREVALKQILDEHADDPMSRHRFVMEAEITGRLEHPGIVPVYGLGTYRNGRPYYAMRFIRGESLKEAIKQFHKDETRRRDPGLKSLGLRKLLRSFLDVCNAIHYAHSRGVLHRDIKPSNVVLGKHGETLLVDWGLAKATCNADPRAEERTLVPVAASGGPETIPGRAMGTPSYMSPEQARGDLGRLGPTSDIYSLGATLYHIICGVVPFPGDDVGAVIQAVVRGDFARPRQVKRSIDLAIEAICLKAMALEPGDRYPTAKALADDVERWMADEPVGAFREPLARRLARWARHNAALVTGAGALLTTAVVALAVSNRLISHERDRVSAARTALNQSYVRIGLERDQAQTARGEAALQKERAELGRAMAQRAVKEMLEEVSRDDLLGIPQAEPLRVKLAERAVAFYREFDRLKPDEPETLYELARLEMDVASLYRMIGKYDRAREEYSATVKTIQALIVREPTSPRYLSFLATTESQIGELIRLRGGTLPEAEPHFREAVRLAADLHQAHPSEANFDSLAARTHNDLANMLTLAGRHAEAEPLAREAAARAWAYQVSLSRRLDPKKFNLESVILPIIVTTHGAVLSKLGRWSEAEVPLRQAIDVLRGLLRDYPENNDAQFLLADALRELAGALAPRSTRRTEAIAALDEGISLVEPLITRFPSIVVYGRYIALIRADRGAVRLEMNQLESARDDLEFARRNLAGRIEKEKNSLEPVQNLGKVKGHLARLALGRGRSDEARALIQEAIDLQQRALIIEPGSLVDKELLENHLAYQKHLSEKDQAR